jgi:hypothetical protein
VASIEDEQVNITLIAAAISAAIGFGAAWQIQGHFLIKQQLGQANERISLQRAARTTLERTLATQQAAQVNAAARGVALRESDAATRAELEQLRNSTQTFVRAAAATPNACPDTAATLAGLLDTMAIAGGELADKAGRHVSDIQTLTEAWTK